MSQLLAQVWQSIGWPAPLFISYLNLGIYCVDMVSSNTYDDSDNKQQKVMIAAVDLMFTLKLDNINLFMILKYLEKS